METTTTPKFKPQSLPAGIKRNDNIEFFGDRESKTVQWIQNGQTKTFKDLPPQIFALLSNAYNRDSAAWKILSKTGAPYGRQVELYTYYVWGSLDPAPDVVNGDLQQGENYRHDSNCISLNFDFKEITLSGASLNSRDLKIIDLIANDTPDKAIAEALGISIPTLGFHKKNLFRKTKSQTKTGLLAKAFRAQIIH